MIIFMCSYPILKFIIVSVFSIDMVFMSGGDLLFNVVQSPSFNENTIIKIGAED